MGNYTAKQVREYMVVSFQLAGLTYEDMDYSKLLERARAVPEELRDETFTNKLVVLEAATTLIDKISTPELRDKLSKLLPSD